MATPPRNTAMGSFEKKPCCKRCCLCWTTISLESLLPKENEKVEESVRLTFVLVSLLVPPRLRAPCSDFHLYFCLDVGLHGRF